MRAFYVQSNPIQSNPIQSWLNRLRIAITFSSILFSLTLLPLRAQDIIAGQGCGYNEIEGCDPFYTIIEETITLPAFPQCPIKVHYAMRYCGELIQTMDPIITFVDRSLCQELIDYLYPNGVNNPGDPIRHVEIWDLAFKAAIDKWFVDKYNSAPADKKLNFECPQGKYSFSVYIASCFQTIANLHPKPTGVGFDILSMSMIACEGSACCVRHRTLCWDKVLGKLVVSEYIEQSGQPGNCSPTKTPGVYPDLTNINDPLAWLNVSSCEAFCEIMQGQ